MSRRGHRFYVANALEIGETRTLPDSTSRQIVHVLRLKPGDCIQLFDGNGNDYWATISTVDRQTVEAQVTGCRQGTSELNPSLTIALALIKHDRFEWALQKLTELGVNQVVPMLTERTVLSFQTDRAAHRLERWQRIIIEAAEQSGRAVLPKIEPVAAFAELVSGLSAQNAILLWEDERSVALADLFHCRPTCLLIGPEGGFSASEVDLARSRGIPTASLGPFILRAETAAVAAAALTLGYRTNQ